MDKVHTIYWVPRYTVSVNTRFLHIYSYVLCKIRNKKLKLALKCKTQDLYNRQKYIPLTYTGSSALNINKTLEKTDPHCCLENDQ